MTHVRTLTRSLTVLSLAVAGAATAAGTASAIDIIGLVNSEFGNHLSNAGHTGSPSVVPAGRAAGATTVGPGSAMHWRTTVPGPDGTDRG